jgi:hypothetical protein
MTMIGGHWLRMVLLATALTVPAAIAQAEPRHDNGHHGYDRRPQGGYQHRHGGYGAGLAIGGALLGLGVGALLGSALSQQAAAPPPGAYYPPPPPGAAYGPPPGAYYP